MLWLPLTRENSGKAPKPGNFERQGHNFAWHQRLIKKVNMEIKEKTINNRVDSTSLIHHLHPKEIMALLCFPVFVEMFLGQWWRFKWEFLQGKLLVSIQTSNNGWATQDLTYAGKKRDKVELVYTICGVFLACCTPRTPALDSYCAFLRLFLILRNRCYMRPFHHHGLSCLYRLFSTIHWILHLWSWSLL